MRKAIAFIGCGNMGEAILSGILHDRIFKRSEIIVSDARSARRAYIKKHYKVLAVSSNLDAVKKSDIVMLAIKPQDAGAVLKELKPVLKDKLIISIAAGITINYIRKRTGANRVARVMPNLAAKIGEGYSAIAATGLSARDEDTVEAIFRCVGMVSIISEKYIDAITAVSGSGPAYFYLLMEAMVEAARSCGLPEDLARGAVRQTALGAAKFAGEQRDISALRKKVTSKGGTTEAALNVFRRKGFERIVKEAVKAAKKRAEQLSK